MTVFFNDIFKGIVEPYEYHENYIRIRSGEERLIAWHNSLLKDENGIVSGLLSSGEDITEQRKQEEALAASEKKYRQLFETSSDGIVFINLTVHTKTLTRLLQICWLFNSRTKKYELQRHYA